jgi:hypothetical protein
MSRRAKRRKPIRQQNKAQAAAVRRAPARKPSPEAAPGGLPSLQTIAAFPFQLILTLLKRAAQVVLSIFFVILHPQFRWLVRLIMRSRLVRDYIRPALQQLSAWLYQPYFAWLRSLPPVWATVSIALPLAILEPAKAYATILIAESPKAGIALWLALQGLSFVLIDKTWTAVRPQARKIWLVSRLHAWGWLMVSYGKYWITASPAYRAMQRWLAEARAAAWRFWEQLAARRRQRGFGSDA